jgi:FAD dependent oxidoreductase TIGR03364
MNTKWQAYGRKSLEIYKEIQGKFDINITKNGSIYIASNVEELTLIEELYQINKENNYASQLLTKAQCLQKYPSLRNDYCIGGLFFPEEISADPRFLVHRIHQFLLSHSNFKFFNRTLITHIHTNSNTCILTDNKGNEIKSKKVILCSGSEFEVLYPQLFEESDIELVKLQMLRLSPQKNHRIPGNILTGLSIRRYESFSECPSYSKIKAAENQDSYYKKWGVHILFKQETDGSIILGDSHEYADVKNKGQLDFNLRAEVNDFFIEEGKKIMNLEHWNVDSAWAGFYSQCKTKDLYYKNIDNKVHIVTGIGGKGMTGSAGFSFDHINELYA